MFLRSCRGCLCGPVHRPHLEQGGRRIQMVGLYFYPVRLLKQNCFLLFQNAQMKKHHRRLDYKKLEQNSYCCLSYAGHLEVQASLCHINKMCGILTTFSSCSWWSDLEQKEAHFTILFSKISLRVAGHFMAFFKTIHCLPFPLSRISLYPEMRQPFSLVPENPCARQIPRAA